MSSVYNIIDSGPMLRGSLCVASNHWGNHYGTCHSKTIMFIKQALVLPVVDARVNAFFSALGMAVVVLWAMRAILPHNDSL